MGSLLRVSIWQRQACRYIFSTEGHIFPMSPEISLVGEHCTYLGSFCNDDLQDRGGSPINSSISDSTAFDTQVSNESWQHCPGAEGFAEESFESGMLRAPLKGVCPGINYWQRVGILPRKEVPAQEEARHVEKPKSLRDKLVELLQSSELQTLYIQGSIRDEIQVKEDVQLSKEGINEKEAVAAQL